MREKRVRETMVKGAANGAFPGVKGGSQRYMKWRKWEHGEQQVGVRMKGYLFETLINRVSTLTQFLSQSSPPSSFKCLSSQAISPMQGRIQP